MEGGAEDGDTNQLFGQFFPENCMKMEEIVPEGASLAPSPVRFTISHRKKENS